MATNLNNIHINSFTKGMNTDTSFDMVSNELYVFGKNIRITNNAFVFGDIDSNHKEGIVCPAPYSDGVTTEMIGSVYAITDILAAKSIDDIGVILVKRENGSWSVIRVRLNGDNIIECENIFTSQIFDDDYWNEAKNKFSLVLNKENDKVLNAYVADGVHQIMIVNVNDNSDYYSGIHDVNSLTSGTFYPVNKIRIESQIDGKLKSGQILYTYRLYRKNGIKSKLAPLTNKLQVINASKNNPIGNEQDSTTNIGFRLKIESEDGAKLFNRAQVFRLSYITPNTTPSIELIFDSKFEGPELYINDDGNNPLMELSYDEYQAMDAMNIIPRFIELNLNYMFAANIKDETVFEVKDYDARAFSGDENGMIQIYENTDTLYSTPRYYDFQDNAQIPAEYTLNEYSDINISQDELASDKRWCKYDQDGYYGGHGANISWRLIYTKVPIHNNIDVPNSIPEYTGDDVQEYVYYLRNGIEVRGASYPHIFRDINICDPSKFTYDNTIVSSVLKSLKRSEVYRYGVVFYDKHGSKSDALWIADIRTPTNAELPNTQIIDNTLYSIPIGIDFSVRLPEGAVSYEIVKCLKTSQYSRNLYQVALARPVRQRLFDKLNGSNRPVDVKVENYEKLKHSPYYPSFYLTSEYQTIVSDTQHLIYYTANSADMSITMDEIHTGSTGLVIIDGWRINEEANNTLFQMFCPEMQVVRNDVSDVIGHNTMWLEYTDYRMSKNDYIDDSLLLSKNNEHNVIHINRYTLPNNTDFTVKNDGIIIDRSALIGNGNPDVKNIHKEDLSFVFYNYDRNDVYNGTNVLRQVPLHNVKDVKNPLWEDGFKNVNTEGTTVLGASKSYKGFDTTIGTHTFVNWVSDGMYDMQISGNSEEGQPGNPYVFSSGNNKRAIESRGWIGPGPVGMIAQLEKHSSHTVYNVIDPRRILHPGTMICNITHTATQFAGLTNQDKQYDVYYGSGYHSTDEQSLFVFDGDQYNLPCEIVSMYKTYEFHSKDTLPSAQVIYYIPIESPINTFFNYGMTYRNTLNKTIQLEPGEIVGVTSQERPQYQYNIELSNNFSIENNESVSEEDIIDDYPQRIHYSELKTSGENIDSWTNFKALDYIDADTRYGDLTNLLTSRDTLYYWQAKAFGKLSVKERSLITDNNSNTIQLGQGGVLQRTDYISTSYGMRDKDFSAIEVEGVVFWIDILNKAIVQSNGQASQSMGKLHNVLNLINKYMIDDVPNIHYDVENNELLCQCLDDKLLLVFNLRANCATSVYERIYDDAILLDNVLYGIKTKTKSSSVDFIKFNHIKEADSVKYHPTVLSFIVNSNPSIHKVFDTQEIVTERRKNNYFMEDVFMSFSTNSTDKYAIDMSNYGYNDREDNIRYSIPRSDADGQYGYRLRGKWMKVDIENNSPREDNSIFAILTKFRQSFS